MRIAARLLGMLTFAGGVVCAHPQYAKAAPLLSDPAVHEDGAATQHFAPAGIDTPLRINRTNPKIQEAVTIYGPLQLLDRARAVFKARGGCQRKGGWNAVGFDIDWGDDPERSRLTPEADCPDPLSHSFSTPGTYRITAIVYHLGPTDSAIEEWRGTATVVVGGAKDKFEFEILTPRVGDVVPFGERAIVRWRIVTRAPSDLLIELLGPNGNVIAEKRVGAIAYDGVGETAISLRGQRYEALLRNGPASAKFRASTLEGGGKAAITESPDFNLSPEFKSRRSEINPQVKVLTDRRLAVDIEHFTYHLGCYSYRIKWGDDSAPDVYLAPSSDRCPLRKEKVVTRHTYKNAGTYSVRIYSNKLELSKPLGEIVSYESVTVQLK